MNIAGDWIMQAGTQALCAALKNNGNQALFVGGCVRNALLGIAVTDIDLATDARPETVSNIAKKAGFHVIPTGIAHGTVTVIAQDVAHEVTTFRRDIATNGRHAVVAFSDALSDDAARRDFTMNAIYAEADGRVIDPLEGMPDLFARRVRFVGDATRRIVEDYLRILRFFRFHAVYGDPELGIDADGLAACAENAGGISLLSRERVGAEMRKLLAAPNPERAVAAMMQSGVLAQVINGADAHALAPLVHLEAGLPARWLRRLAVLGGQNADSQLRLSRGEVTDLAKIRDEIGSGLSAAALGWRLGAELAQDAVLCRSAVLEMPLTPNWQKEIHRGAHAICPVTAADLMPALQGPALGARLKLAEKAWLASDLHLTKAKLLD